MLHEVAELLYHEITAIIAMQIKKVNILCQHCKTKTMPMLNSMPPPSDIISKLLLNTAWEKRVRVSTKEHFLRDPKKRALDVNTQLDIGYNDFNIAMLFFHNLKRIVHFI